MRTRLKYQVEFTTDKGAATYQIDAYDPIAALNQFHQGMQKFCGYRPDGYKIEKLRLIYFEIDTKRQGMPPDFTRPILSEIDLPRTANPDLLRPAEPEPRQEQMEEILAAATGVKPESAKP